MRDSHASGSEERYGWVMVAVAAIFLGAGNGSLVTISVFLAPLTAEFGWLRGETAFAYMAGAISVGFGGLVMGYLADRFSTRWVVLVGAIALGMSYLLLAHQTSLWQFYLFYCLMGGLGTAAFFAPLIANVGSWFDQHKGLAIGIITAGQALGQGIVPFVAGYLIASSGWREAYTTLGIVSLVLLIPLASLVRTPPDRTEAPTATSQEGPSASHVADRIAPHIVVSWLSATAIFCCICMATPAIHVVALAQDMGIDAKSAASVLSLLYVAGVFGRITFGKVADHIGGIRAYLLASASQTVLVFWFAQMPSLVGFYVLAVLFGLANSGVMTCLMVCVRERIPLHRRGVAVGMVTLFAWIGMGLGGFQGGFFFDLTRNYTASYANAAVSGVVNLMIFGSFAYYINRQRMAAAKLKTA
jgi:MFS family permease